VAGELRSGLGVTVVLSSDAGVVAGSVTSVTVAVVRACSGQPAGVVVTAVRLPGVIVIEAHVAVVGGGVLFGVSAAVGAGVAIGFAGLGVGVGSWAVVGAAGGGAIGSGLVVA
jgi:hypothetical protein